MKPFKRKCPYCNTYSTIKDDNFHQSVTYLTIENASKDKSLYNEFIVCPNPDCNKYTLTAYIFDTKYTYTGNRYEYVDGKLLKEWNLIPNSQAQVFPDYIPKPLITDYEEACSIKELSPKASATLSRRCLQGMIRDFWKISKPRLVDEINAIEDKVDPLTWKSIDAIRKIGNIGAHMEKDINLIIDVDPNEAQMLIELIELLFNEWYINRFEREERLNKIIGISKSKEVDKAEKK
ncbi:DUF4145 domain-containing protein [Flavobacterium sp. CYK-4]|uniref:DUF4145 domain-containing protein n=1 Tax=Flavobacterium lotistagni TaxID=2709660 RepID=UPI00140A4CB9|nr:DUF4145 domain-containing protein [Flavobacterium lotistagni]NHM08332.1 DUF4145 domain-containing protein [Flavobacterium lotistagni]